MANYIQSDHHTITIDSADIVKYFYEALWHAETPVFRSAFVPLFLLARCVREKGIKVVLTGEGADESFLGYDIFKETVVREQWSKLSSTQEKIRLLKKLYPYWNLFQNNIESLVSFFDNITYQTDCSVETFSHLLRFNNGKFSQRLTKQKNHAIDMLVEYIHQKYPYKITNPLEYAQHIEFNTLLHGCLLSTQGDRMSCAFGVETRLPFLDPRIISLANRLAQSIKLTTDFSEKYVLKEAFKNKLPPIILSRPKQAYRAPDEAVVQLANKTLRPEFITKKIIQDLDFLDNDFIQIYLSRLDKINFKQISSRDTQTFLFLLSTCMIWHRFTEFYRLPKYDLSHIVCRFSPFLRDDEACATDREIYA